MGDHFRSKTYADGRMEMEIYYGENNENPTNNTATNSSNNDAIDVSSNNNSNVRMHELRCYSASYVTTSSQQQQNPKQLKKGKSVNASSSSKAGWCFSDPEMARKKRVASYKAYSVEGKIKKSFSKSFRWIKDRYSNMLQGW